MHKKLAKKSVELRKLTNSSYEISYKISKAEEELEIAKVESQKLQGKLKTTLLEEVHDMEALKKEFAEFCNAKEFLKEKKDKFLDLKRKRNHIEVEIEDFESEFLQSYKEGAQMSMEEAKQVIEQMLAPIAPEISFESNSRELKANASYSILREEDISLREAVRIMDPRWSTIEIARLHTAIEILFQDFKLEKLFQGKSRINGGRSLFFQYGGNVYLSSAFSQAEVYTVHCSDGRKWEYPQMLDKIYFLGVAKNGDPIFAYYGVNKYGGREYEGRYLSCGEFHIEMKSRSCAGDLYKAKKAEQMEGAFALYEGGNKPGKVSILAAEGLGIETVSPYIFYDHRRGVALEPVPTAEVKEWREMRVLKV